MAMTEKTVRPETTPDLCSMCQRPLVRTEQHPGVIWCCPECGGRAVGLGLLRKRVPARVVNALWQDALQARSSVSRPRPCPLCTQAMREVTAPDMSPPVHLDVCLPCQMIWFDGGEEGALPPLAARTSYTERLPAAARERLAMVDVAEYRRRAEDEASDHGPSEWWQWLPAIFGLPVELNQEPVARPPWVTWTVSFLVLATGLLAFGDLSTAAETFGLVPQNGWRLGGLTLFSSFFVHAGVGHLLGNLYFLMIFGDNVESHLGRWRFLLLLVAATLAGSLAHLLVNASSAVPCIGASGGISGVLAYYAFRFPRVRVGILFRLAIWLRIPVWAAFLLWVAFQGVVCWRQLAGCGSVSGVAHLGGAAVGLLFWLLGDSRRSGQGEGVLGATCSGDRESVARHCR